jgi:hypothetical protein
MTRFAWLQARVQSLSGAAIIVILAIVAAITGIELSHLYHSTVASCTGNCDLTINHFLSHDSFLQGALNFLLRIAPAILGVFWGAPLVAREFEAGTYRLAWTQSVSRSRWLLTKLAIGALATIIAAGAFSLIVTWWFRGIDHVNNNQFDVFDARDIVPIGYALFAFMLGAFVGAVARRTLPAMAVTLGGVIFARIATMLWVRPHLLPPVHKTMSLLQAGGIGFEIRNGGQPILVAKGDAPANAWELSSHLVTSSGHRATTSQLAAFVHQYCPSIGAPPAGGGPTGGQGIRKAPDIGAFDACRTQAARLFHVSVTYQPANHYWPLQALEFGLFAVLALACAGGCYWWVTRRAV